MAFLFVENQVQRGASGLFSLLRFTQILPTFYTTRQLRRATPEQRRAGVPQSRYAKMFATMVPAGSDAQALKRAARDFAREEFYVHAMALHTHLDDPAKEPSPHPLVHLCVKIADEEGRHLNPRKANLRRWRERLRALPPT